MKRILISLANFFHAQRRSGTSSLLKTIATNNDVWILVAKIESKKEFGENAISISELERTEGKIKKPILVDNHTMITLFEGVYNDIIQLESKVKKRNELISDIEKLIQDFKNENIIEQ